MVVKNKKKRSLTAVLLSLLMVLMVPSYVGADATADSSSGTSDWSWSDATKVDNLTEDTVRGVDLSLYQANVSWKKQFTNYKQKNISLLTFLKSQGVNTASVKVAVNPSDSDRTAKNLCNLSDAITTLKAANKAGMKTNLVLMYSDWVTSSTDQTPSKSWEGDPWTQGEDNGNQIGAGPAIDYTNSVIKELKAAGFTPDMITIGNDVNYNFLGFSDAWKGWKAMGDISQIIRNYSSEVKIGIGISAPGDAKNSSKGSEIQWVLDELNKEWNNVQYDYVGVMLWGNYYSTDYITAMRDTFTEKEKDKNRDATLYISNANLLEESTEDTADSRLEQAKEMYEMLSATVSEDNTGGIIVNEALMGWSGRALFDNYGHARNSIAALAYAAGNKVDVSEYYNPYEYGGEPGLKSQKVNIKKINGMTKDMIRGVDVSSYISLKNAGVKFYNEEGKEEPLLKILSDNGVNSVRIRVWNDPYNSEGKPYGGGSVNLERALEIAKEAKEYGMSITLDLFYSDFWADPHQQTLPKAWQADANDTTKMQKHYYDYTKEVFESFNKAGIKVAMVQIGNEITNGIPGQYTANQGWQEAWNNKSKVKNRTKNSCLYLSAGCQAVRKYSPKTKIILQLEKTKYSKYNAIMKTWKKYKVSYDVLGTSYYPFWSGSYGNKLSDLKAVAKLARSYGKSLCVMETSWLNSLNDADGTNNQVGKTGNATYKVGPQGQVDALTDMYKVLCDNYNCLGAYYWEPAWIPTKPGQHYWKENKETSEKFGNGWAARAAEGYAPDSKMFYNGQPTAGASGWDNMSLFDFNGYMLQSLKFYKNSTGPVAPKVTVSNCTYNGKRRKPKVTVTIRGEKIAAKYYKVKYSSGRKKVGKYTVTVTVKKKAAKKTATYTTSATGTFKIKPVKTKLKSLKTGKKKVKATWKKKKKQVSGYQVQVSTKKSFKASATKSYLVKSNKTTKKTISKLKAKKRYYVRVRTYKTVKGVKYYSSWSNKKSVKTK